MFRDLLKNVLLTQGVISSFESEVAQYEAIKDLLKVYELISHIKVLNRLCFNQGRYLLFLN